VKTKDTRHGFNTRTIHAGQSPDPTTGAVMQPIYATSTYAQESPGKHKGFEYSRTQNPTRMAYERCVADLENGTRGYAFASGLASTATILDLLDTGSHVVAMDDMYGGTYRLFERVRKRSAGLKFSFVDLRDRKALEAALRPETKLIWVETPTNPTLKIADLAMIAEVAKKRGIITVCDNTFASPCLQRPLEHGFDLVMHSATKFLNGHSDMVGGMVVGMIGGTRLASARKAPDGGPKRPPLAGTKPLMTAGFIIMAAGLGLGALTKTTSGTGFAATWIALSGLGMGMAMPQGMNIALGALSAERSGSGSALISALRQVGATIGVAILGTVLSSGYHDRLTSYPLPVPAVRPTVIVQCGKLRVPAIKAALGIKIANALITDENTARMILED